jgi:adenosylcobinamide amidohydrolase
MNRGRVALDRPWLTFDLGGQMNVLSWALNRPGLVKARRIVWREVRDADLPEDFDVGHWLAQELSDRGEAESVAFLTSRSIDRSHYVETEVGSVKACALVTVGLSNVERVGYRRHGKSAIHGTINIAAQVNVGLSEAGLLEAMSIVVQARTTAILDAEVPLPSGAATGTGTDCVAIAAPAGDTCFAGLHTEVGEALGRAVYNAVHDGATEWQAEQDPAQNG